MSVEQGWSYRRLLCGTCGAEIDRQLAQAGAEGIVGLLLTDGIAMRVHKRETGCAGGEIVKGDWKPIPEGGIQDQDMAEGGAK